MPETHLSGATPATKCLIPSARKSWFFVRTQSAHAFPRFDLRISPKEALGVAFEESRHKIGGNSHIHSSQGGSSEDVQEASRKQPRASAVRDPGGRGKAPRWFPEFFGAHVRNPPGPTIPPHRQGQAERFAVMTRHH